MKRRYTKYSLFMLLLLVCTTVFANNPAASSILSVACPSDDNDFGYTKQPVISTSEDSPVLPSNGVFDVSQAGAATYSYAINAPQGVGGMNPNIAITYNSQSGNGIVGWGCSISGISAITRGMKTVFHDGLSVGIQHTNDDVYYVDGVRLRFVPGTKTGPGATYIPENAPYIKYACNTTNGNLSFSVTADNGLTYEYGATSDSRQIYTAPSGYNTVYTWYISKVTDHNGNYIAYRYTTDNGTVYPKEIIYGSNTKQDTYTYNYIRFNYEQRPDVLEYLLWKHKMEMSLRLSSIEIGTNADTYRTYTFQYTTEDLSGKPFSRLHTITEQNAAGESRPPVTFQWDNLPAFSQKVLTPEIHLPKGSYTNTGTCTYEVKIENETFFACDMTGDGLADIVEFASYSEIDKCGGHTSTVDNTHLYVYQAINYNGVLRYILANTFKLGFSGSFEGFENNKLSSYQLDFDGDGLADICIPQYITGGGYKGRDIVFAIARGKDVISRNSIPKGFSHKMKSNDNSPLFTATDIDNDGRTEVIVLEKELYEGSYICEIIGYKDENGTIHHEYKMALPEAPKNIFTGDFNNDGMPDLMIVYEHGYKIYFNHVGNFQGGGMFNEYNCISSNSLTYADRMFQGDFNGDGLVDFLTNCTNNSSWYFHFNQGNGAFQKKYAGMPGLYKHSDGKDDDKMQCMVFDFDNDGKSDVVMTNYVNSSVPSKTVWMRSTGSSLVPVKESVSNNEQTSLAARFAVGCFTGSGQMELMNYGSDCYNSDNSESKVHIYTNESFTPSSGKVTAITDETGRPIDISYSSLTDTNVYSQGNACTYPVVSTTVPMHVVSAVKTDNGAAGNAETTYKYTGMQTHVAGRGFLGFATVSASNNTTGNKIETTTESWDETNFVPTKTIVKKSTGGAVETTKVTNTYKHFPNKTFALEETISETVDPDIFYSTLYKVYDTQYGYLLSEKEEGDITSNYHETVYSDYKKYGSKWLPSTITYIDSNEDADDPVERETHITYNENGQKVSECINYGTSQPITHEYQYDIFGNVTSSSTSGNGVDKIEDLAEYDSSGRFVVKKQTSPASTILTYTHDMWGNLLSETDATNPAKPLTTTYTYNSWGQAESATSPTGVRAKTIRGWNNDTAKRYYVLELADGAPWVKNWYDSMGREVLTESVGLKDIELSTLTEYNKRGLPVQVISQTGDISVTKTLQYDSRGRVTSETSSSAGTITCSYNGRDVTVNDNGRESTKVYGDGGLVRYATDTSGEIGYTYNAFGKPMEVAVISFANPVTMEYDDVGNRTALNDPDAGRTTYTYDALGRLRTRTDARGHKTSYNFDTLGRKTQVLGDGEVFAEYKYGESGNDAQKLIEERSGDMRTTYSYDEYGRLSSKTRHIDGEELSYSYTYNPLGQVTRIVYPGGVTADYGYDCYGNNTSISVGGKEVWSVGSYTGKSLSTLFSNGHFYEYNSYDDSGRLVSQSIMEPSEGLYDTSYSYNKETGNLTNKALTHNWGWVWELSDNVKDDTAASCNQKVSTVNLQSVDNPKQKLAKRNFSIIWEYEFCYDNADRLIQARRKNYSPQSVEYADNGNILSKSDIGTYKYDSGHKHAVTGIDAAETGYKPDAQEIAYNFLGKAEAISDWNNDTYKELSITYGPDMERWKSTLSINYEEKRTILYFNDYECVKENGIVRQFYYLGGNVILVRESGKDDLCCFAMTDNQGSVLYLFSDTGGHVFSAEYDAWGKQKVMKNDIGFLRGYTGHEMLPEFDLINMNGRIYDPALGRFLNPDNYVQMPDNTQSFNRYSYCINNPLKYTDPSGEYFGIDDLIAGLFGGVMNLTINIFQGNISGDLWTMIGKGASAFGSGAVAGIGALYPELGGWAWGGATLGATNAWLSGGNGTDIFSGAILGSLTSYFGGAMGQWGAQYLGSIAINGLQITSPFLQAMVSGAVGGMTSGWAISFATSLILTGDFDEALSAGNNGLLSGMVTGTIAGGIGGIKASRDNKVSPWTGEKTQNHHSFPKFAGGTDEQVLTPVPESLHREMHKEMNQYLYEMRTSDGLHHMRPQRGNSGSIIQNQFSTGQRFSAMKNFYDLHPFKYAHTRYDFYMNNGIQWQWRPW